MNKILIVGGLLDWTIRKLLIGSARSIPGLSTLKRFPFLILPSMSAMEYAFLHSLMRQHRNYIYIEYGCGGSTILADRFFRQIVSSETDRQWCDKINSHLKNGLVRFVNVGETGAWGNPKAMNEGNARLIADIHQERLAMAETEKESLLILIDGRCRVLTACSIFRYLKGGDFVLIHDFTNRREYYDVLKMYDLLEPLRNATLTD